MNRVTRIWILPIVTLAVTGWTLPCRIVGGGDATLYSVVKWPSRNPPAAGNTPTDDQLQLAGTTNSAPARVAQAVPPPPPRPAPELIPQGPAKPGRPNEDQDRALDATWKPIGEVSASITPPAGELPTDLAAARFAQAGVIGPPESEFRDWEPVTYCWAASGLYHNPLYFEEINLERYGYTWGLLQPGISAIHFFGTVPLLPYKMVAQPPHECVYTLGYYRPGDCVPRQHEHIPFKGDAAMVETAVILGLVFVLP